MGSCFSKRRQSEPNYVGPEKGHQISGAIKTPISVLPPLKVCNEANVGFDETVQKIQSKRETRGRRASVKERSEHLSESGKRTATHLQATVQESLTICARTGDPLLDAPNTGKNSLVPSIEPLKQMLVAQKQEPEIAHCDEVSASLDAQYPSDKRHARETVGELSRKRELTRILDSMTVKLDSALHPSATEATSNAMDTLTNQSNVNVSKLGSITEANLKPEVAHDSHKIDELKVLLGCDLPAPLNSKACNERQEFSKTTETEQKVTEMKVEGNIAVPKIVDPQLLGGGKQYVDKDQKTDEAFHYSNEVGVTWQLGTRSITDCDLRQELDVAHHSFSEDGIVDLNHITFLEHESVVKDERHKEFVKPRERDLPHELNEDEPLHDNEGICMNKEDAFVAYRPNKNSQQPMSHGLDEQVFPQERFMSSVSHHFIILENLSSNPKSSSSSEERREGFEDYATSESDSETFEFQHTMDYYQENFERTEQKQETVIVEQANKRKRGWGLFEYEDSSVKRGKTAPKLELASEQSGVIDDLVLSRDNEKHRSSRGMLEMQQQRTSEEDINGFRGREDLFASGSSEHALIFAGSNTEELHFVPCGLFVPDTPPISSITRLAANTPLRLDPYHRQQDASALSLENIISLLEKEELDEEDLLSMLTNAKSTCQTSDVASESSFEFKIKSAGSTPHSTPSTPMLSAGSTPRRINQINPMALTPEEIAEIWGVFEPRQTLAFH